jgi:hypothetical protein
MKIDLLHRGPKSFKLLYSVMNLNTISLPTKARPTNDILPNLPSDFIKFHGVNGVREWWKDGWMNDSLTSFTP